MVGGLDHVLPARASRLLPGRSTCSRWHSEVRHAAAAAPGSVKKGGSPRIGPPADTESAWVRAQKRPSSVPRRLHRTSAPASSSRSPPRNNLLQWHPHLHLLTTDGGFAPAPPFLPLPGWGRHAPDGPFPREDPRPPPRSPCHLPRVRPEAARLAASRLLRTRGRQHRSGGDQRLEDTAAYLVRNPLSLRKLVYLDGQQAVLYRSRTNPSLGRNFEALDPLEWLARMERPHPRPRTAPHRLLRAVRQPGPGRRSARRGPDAGNLHQAASPTLVAHMGQPHQDKPPPAREILRVAEHGEGWGVPAEWS